MDRERGEGWVGRETVNGWIVVDLSDGVMGVRLRIWKGCD